MMIELPKNVIDETGHSYGRLTVIEYAGRDESQAIGGRGGPALWRCRCECGEETTVRGARLRSGRIVSCGCWRADPNIRQAARLKVSAKKRKQIARLGGAARAAKTRRAD